MQYIACPFLILVGLALILVPAKWILAFDRRTGYYLYCKELAASGNEQKALAKASHFYKTLGICIAAMAIAVLIATICVS